MRPQTMVVTAAAVAALTLTASAAVAAAAATGPSEAPASHHLGGQMTEFGIGLGQMHHGMVEGASHDQMHQRQHNSGVVADDMRDAMAGMRRAHDPGWMHD